MTDALAIRDPIGRVVESVTSDASPTLERFASELGVSSAEAVSILTDKDVSKALQDTTKARARLALHGRGIARLIAIAATGDDQQALSAINTLARLAGDLKPQGINVRLSFDELIKQATVSAGPLAGITQIAEGVIDAEEGDDSDD
jgi:hypothetical protein